MKFVALSNVQHNGVLYELGDVLEIDDKEQAKTLLNDGIVRKAKTSKEAAAEADVQEAPAEEVSEKKTVKAKK